MADQNADLLKQADELGIKVDGRWSDERIQQEIDTKLGAQPFGGKGDHDGNGKAGGAVKLATVTLLRHYRPSGAYEIVGHWRPKVEAKNAQGTLVEIQPAQFVNGEPMPAPQSGVGGDSTKLWAGTTVRLPVDEAKAVRRNGVAEVEIDDD